MNPVCDMEQRPLRVPKLAWVKEEEEGPGAVPAQESGLVEQFQLLQDDAATDQTQEQDPARGRFSRAAQMICKFIKCIWQEETSVMGTGSVENGDISNTDASTSMLDLLVNKGVPCPEQVPAMVRYIHRWLMANESGEHKLDNTLLELTEAQPTDVVITLLRVAPSCDRAATTMWSTILSSRRTARLVVLILLEVLSNWPEHITHTSDGDNTDVFALAATLVMWKILQGPCWPQEAMLYFPRLFVHLLFQVFFSTEQMPQKVNTFWRACREEHRLPTNPNRFVVQTLEALLRRLEYEDVVVAMERQHGWDTLLCPDTQHYAVGLLAREMRSGLPHLCSRIALHLLGLLRRRRSRWYLLTLAFFVEVLECLDLSKCGDSVLEIMLKNLRSECRERRRLALSGLMVLSNDPSLAEKMWSLTESLVEFVRENDSGVVRMSIIVLSRLFLANAHPLPGRVALQLAEPLVPLFDNDDSQVQMCSMYVFREVMDLIMRKRKKALKSHVRQSLLPLSFHCHDESQHVAEVSRETLLCAARFLKRRDLEQMLQLDQTWRFGEGLLAEDRSRAAEHLRRALPYLRSPQTALREAAVRFIGIAGRHLRRQKEELQLICEALEDMTDDISPAVSRLAAQTLYVLRAAKSAPYSIFPKLRDRLRRACKTRPRLWGCGWLHCWSSAES
ncbi:maestro heat-like repeat-containing protein family member 7 [Aphelocoma coerulescens]|uniref:maestro heat-like repeat-containing protein family member 7 n=1 Tax=Aphelocoma coerulescens TaxID=39617 RepID=UPI003604CAAB